MPDLFKVWHGIRLIYFPKVEGLGEWLYGQTLPYVEDDLEPTSWCYYDDYVRFISKLPIID